MTLDLSTDKNHQGFIVTFPDTPSRLFDANYVEFEGEFAAFYKRVTTTEIVNVQTIIDWGGSYDDIPVYGTIQQENKTNVDTLIVVIKDFQLVEPVVSDG